MTKLVGTKTWNEEVVLAESKFVGNFWNKDIVLAEPNISCQLHIKEPLGAVLQKRCSKVCFCQWFWSVLDNAVSAEENICSAENRSELA